jgi:hypothetical protein
MAPMKKWLNPGALAAFAFCAAVWALAGVTGGELAHVYAVRGPHGFRHALEARLDHRLHQLRSIVVVTERRLA